MTQFQTRSIVALVSATFGYLAGWLQVLRENRRRRRSLASAFLIGLRWFEPLLRKLREDETAANNLVEMDSSVFHGQADFSAWATRVSISHHAELRTSQSKVDYAPFRRQASRRGSFHPIAIPRYKFPGV